MSTYIRGPVCGVDNCPSRLWRVINGRRTCQYGHVMEGDVEFNDDDDNVNVMSTMTRRMNLTTNAVGSFQSNLSMSQLQESQTSKHQSKKLALWAGCKFIIFKGVPTHLEKAMFHINK